MDDLLPTTHFVHLPDNTSPPPNNPSPRLYPHPPLTTFPRYADLPLELRNLILSHAIAASPRCIEVTNHAVANHFWPHTPHWSANPSHALPLTQVSRAIRAEVLTRYERPFQPAMVASGLGMEVWVNWEVDTVSARRRVLSSSLC